MAALLLRNSDLVLLPGSTLGAIRDDAQLLADSRPDDGFTPLHAAAWMGKYDTAKLLLEEGLGCFAQEHQGPRHTWRSTRHHDCVRLLLRWGAKVNVRMSGGATPLFLAVEKGPAAVARLLLRWGADPGIPQDGETVFTATSTWWMRALLAENYLSAGAPLITMPTTRKIERAGALPAVPAAVDSFFTGGRAALVVVLVSADWTQRKLRDYFLRPLARITNRVSPRGYQTYDWEE